MKTSNHAKTRIKERCGLGKDSGDRLAAIALEKGLKRNEANGQLKRYMDKLYFTNPDAGNIRIYAEKSLDIFRRQIGYCFWNSQRS